MTKSSITHRTKATCDGRLSDNTTHMEVGSSPSRIRLWLSSRNRTRRLRVLLSVVVVACFSLLGGGMALASMSSSSAKPAYTTVVSESPVSDSDYNAKSAPAKVSAEDGKLVELKGVFWRDEQTRAQTGMGWSRVVYYLQLDTPATVTYTDARGKTASADMNRIAVNTIEQYGDDADRNLRWIEDDHWDYYVGRHVKVTGQLVDTGNAHTVGPVMFRGSGASK